MSCCAFCGVTGHNIRNCNNNSIAFALMKLRCKHWESVRKSNLSITSRWLTSQDITTLRVICIHKYRTFPKTKSKIKLVAIIMHLEFWRIVEEEDESFWKCDLPDGFTSSAYDCNNDKERELLIVNINTYQSANDELRFKLNDDLADILMNLIIEYRQLNIANRHTRYRARINYIETSAMASNECSICYDETDNLAMLGCKHEFCCGCIETHIRGARIATVNCPLCRGEINSVSAIRHGNNSLISIL